MADVLLAARSVKGFKKLHIFFATCLHVLLMENSEYRLVTGFGIPMMGGGGGCCPCGGGGGGGAPQVCPAPLPCPPPPPCPPVPIAPQYPSYTSSGGSSGSCGGGGPSGGCGSPTPCSPSNGVGNACNEGGGAGGCGGGSGSPPPSGCGGGGSGCVSSTLISSPCASVAAPPSAPCAPSAPQQPCTPSFGPAPYSPPSQSGSFVQTLQGNGGGTNTYAIPQPAPSTPPYSPPQPTIQPPYNPPPPPPVSYPSAPVAQPQYPPADNSYSSEPNTNYQKDPVAEKDKSQILTNKIVKVSTRPGMSPDLYEDKVPDLDEYPDHPSSTTMSSSHNTNSQVSTKGDAAQPEKDDKLTQDYSESSFLYKSKLSGVPQTDTQGSDSTGDPKCSSETLRIIMQENIVSSPTISKQLIFSAGRLAFGQSIDVVCSKNKFSYTVVSSKVFCEASRGRITCFAFLQP